jgi:hypothetical protein
MRGQTQTPREARPFILTPEFCLLSTAAEALVDAGRRHLDKKEMVPSDPISSLAHHRHARH